nr:uncharacterized protein LOC128700987 [Cherax quadricarinatus]
MPRLGFLSFFSRGQRGRSSGDGEGSCSNSDQCSNNSGKPWDATPEPSTPRTPAKYRRSGHWSPPQPRPLGSLERSSSHEMPRSLTASGSWDETEPPSPVLTLPMCAPLDNRPLSDGEIHTAARELRRRSSRDVIKEAVTKILDDKKARRERSWRVKDRERGTTVRSRYSLRKRHKLRLVSTPDTDDDSIDFNYHTRQRHQWRERLKVMGSTDAESDSYTESIADTSPVPSPRPNIAKRASNFFLKSFKAMSANILLNKKYIPTYYLSGTHEMPEPDQILSRLGHSLDSQLESRRPSVTEPRSLCVVWDLSPEDVAPVQDTSSSSPATTADTLQSSPGCHPHPYGDEDHIYEDLCFKSSGSTVKPPEDTYEDCGDGFAAQREQQRYRLSQWSRVMPASALVTLHEGKSDQCGRQKVTLVPRQPSPYPARCRSFQSPGPRSRSDSPRHRKRLFLPAPLPPRPPLHVAPPRPPVHPGSALPPVHPGPPLHPGALQPSQHPEVSSPPPLPPGTVLPPLSPQSPHSQLLQRSLQSASPAEAPAHNTTLLKPPLPPLPTRTAEVKTASGKPTEGIRDIAHRRKGTRVSSISIPLGVQCEEPEEATLSPTPSSPIYAQPFASSPGEGTPSYTTPFRDIYSLTPTLLSPSEAKEEVESAPLSLPPQNVFFGQDFNDEGSYLVNSPPAAQNYYEPHRDSAYFSTDEGTDAPNVGDHHRPPEVFSNPSSPPSSKALLKKAIEHSFVDSLNRLPEIVASEVNRQVRHYLSASEITTEIRKQNTVDSSDNIPSTLNASRSLSCSRHNLAGDETTTGEKVDTYERPVRPSFLDLQTLHRRKHSYSCQDLLGEDMFQPGVYPCSRQPRINTAISFADLNLADQLVASRGPLGLSDHTASMPAHLHHLPYIPCPGYQSVPEVEVEGMLVDLPRKHHLPLKEALKPLCRELRRSLLLKEAEESPAGAHSKHLVLKLNVKLDQVEGDLSDSSMEWDYFDQRNGKS